MKLRPAVASLAVSCTALASPYLVPPSQASATTPGVQSAMPLLRVGMAEAFSSLDPTVPGGAFSNIADSLALEQLQDIGPNGRLQDVLAYGVSEPNRTTYVFTLRPGVKFWDGDTLTSADVVTSLDWARRAGSHFNGELAPIESVTADGPGKATITLAEPDAAFLFTLAFSESYIFEKAFFEQHRSSFGDPSTLEMGTGPWVVQSLDPTRGVVLTANPDWWGGAVPFKEIEFTFFSNETSEALALRAGEIDVSPLVENGNAFASTSGAHMTYATSCNNAFISMPTQTAPWNDVHIRRAVAYAVNRPAIITATGFRAVPTGTLIEPSQLETIGTAAQVNNVLNSLPSYPFSVAEAKKEMAESSEPNGFSTTLLTFNYGSFLDVDQVIANELAPIGIKVKIDNIGQSAWFAAIGGEGAPRPFTYTTAGGCAPDPSFQNIWYGSHNALPGGLNLADWTPPLMDQLLTKSLAAPTNASRLAVYAQMLKLLAVDEPYVPLYEQDVSFASNDFTWPGFSQFWGSSEWALLLRPRT